MDDFLIKMMREMENKLKELMGEREYYIFSSGISKKIFKEELMNHPVEEFRMIAEDPDVFDAITGNDYEFNALMETERELRQILSDDEEEE